ncbi:Aste57867_9008 [Aphanomyces stellatus]|uniref:Aste57867_9008 protein n=1 Tax=Aphanomyces stellatus TaxID=120398 RepID=A0A485KLQ8_9STRA|nr:hypothetical protein As57867_008973 [Aphanomyces stellatus]VFT85892.1 Aste57867_9008 [Aphanomyces stellatus]
MAPVNLSTSTVRVLVNGTAVEYSWSDFAVALHLEYNSNSSSPGPLDVFASQDAVDAVWVAFCGFQILLVQVGLSFSSPSSDAKCIGVSGAVVLLSYALTFGLSFGPGTFLGTEGFFLLSYPLESSVWALWVLHTSVQLTMTSLVFLTLAHRVARPALFCYLLLLNVFVYPVVVHAVWSPYGWANRANSHPSTLTALDLAGCSVVHVTAGAAVFVATCFTRVVHPPDKTPPSTLSSESSLRHGIGTWLVLLGWFGLIHTSTTTLGGACPDVALRAAINLALSAAAASLSAASLSLRFPLSHALNHGLMSGLVAISAAASAVTPAWAIFIGLLAGVLFVGTAHTTRLFQLHDVLEVVPVHLANGFWGLVAAGLFSSSDRILAASQCNATPRHFHVVVSSTAVATCCLWEGCAKQFGANVVFALLVALFVGLVCVLAASPWHYMDRFVGPTPSLSPPRSPSGHSGAVDDFYPTDDDATPWSFDLANRQSDVITPDIDDQLQSSVERRYRFSQGSSHSNIQHTPSPMDRSLFCE